MRFTTVVAGLRRDERALADHLRSVSARHEADAEVHHLALDLADWSDRHAAALEPWADAEAPPVLLHGGDLPSDPSLLLLADLRAVFLHASDVALTWELVGVTAQALHDDELQQLQRRCHEESVRQMRWAAGLAKQGAPQALGR